MSVNEISYKHIKDLLAGYERQKRDIEDTVLLALTYPEIYEQVTQKTRMRAGLNKYFCSIIFLMLLLSTDREQSFLRDLLGLVKLLVRKSSLNE